MTEAYDWSWLRNRMPVVDLSAYLSMPEDVARLIEVRDGMILHCESPSPNHVAICDNFKSALRDAVAKRSAEDSISVIGVSEAGGGLVMESFGSRGVRRTYGISLERGVCCASGATALGLTGVSPLPSAPCLRRPVGARASPGGWHDDLKVSYRRQ